MIVFFSLAHDERALSYLRRLQRGIDVRAMKWWETISFGRSAPIDIASRRPHWPYIYGWISLTEQSAPICAELP